MLFKTSKSNIPSIKNFIENHNRYKANLGEVLRTNINIRWSEDELEKQWEKKWISLYKMKGGDLMYIQKWEQKAIFKKFQR